MFVVPEKELWNVSGWLKELAGDYWALAINVLDLPVDDDSLMARAMPVLRFVSSNRSRFVFDKEKGRMLAQITLTEVTLCLNALDVTVVLAGNPRLLDQFERMRVPNRAVPYPRLIPRKIQHVCHTR